MPLIIPGGEPEPGPAPARGHGSAEEEVGGEIIGAAADLPWDSYLGAGAAARIGDGSLGLVRHAYPATAAHDLRAAATAAGALYGDAATHERLAAVATTIAAVRHRPARLPHRPGDEPHAWWIAEERTLVWLPWADVDEPPYGLALLDTGEADAVTVIAPDACWTVFRTGIPERGASGTWETLPERFRAVVADRVNGVEVGVIWTRKADHVLIRWRSRTGKVASATIEVNRARFLPPPRA